MRRTVGSAASRIPASTSSLNHWSCASRSSACFAIAIPPVALAEPDRYVRPGYADEKVRQVTPRPIPRTLRRIDNPGDVRMPLSGIRVIDAGSFIAGPAAATVIDRESVGEGTSVSVSVDLGGRRIIKKK